MTIKKETPTVNERMVVLNILLEVLEKDQFSHIVIRQALEKYAWLPKQSRAFISRLSKGCIEKKILLDAVIDRVSKTPVKKMKPVIRNVLRMTAYQLLFMDQIPASAACNEAVKLAAGKGFQNLRGFVNGVSRNMERQKAVLLDGLDKWERHSMPEWLWNQFCSWYGEEMAERMANAFESEEHHGIPVHFLLSRASEEAIRRSLQDAGVTVTASPLASQMYELSGVDSMERLEAFQKGWIQVQDVSSALSAQILAPERGMRCLDVCSAPGGKAVHLADSLNGTGMVVCRDLSEAKLPMIEENMERCGFTDCTYIEASDASVLRKDSIGKFDRVLADLPCSGLGIIGHKPDIKYHVSREGLSSLVQLQRKILSVIWQYTSEDGVLVYSTCTLNPAENIENIQWFLANFPFELESLVPFVPGTLLNQQPKDGMLTLLPGVHPTDGFFIARMRRRRVEKG